MTVQTPPSASPARVGFRRGYTTLLAGSIRLVRDAGPPLIAVMLSIRVVILLVAFPLVDWLFREALRADGMMGLDLSRVRLTPGLGISVVLIAVIGLIFFWLAVVDIAAIIVIVDRARKGEPFSVREVLRRLGRLARRLFRPSSAPLAIYLFLVLPLSGFGFASILTSGVAVPPFISGELMKEPGMAYAWTGAMLLLAWLNLRFSASIAAFVLTDDTGAAAMARSWRRTAGWTGLALAAAVVTVLVAVSLVSALVVAIAVVPTSITDDVAPAASPAVAAFSLGVANVVAVVMSALLTALCAAMTVLLIAGPAATEPRQVQRAGWRVARVATAAGCVGAAVVIGFTSLPLMQTISEAPSTTVLAHRGFVNAGVENTLSALRGAAAAHADAVEMDVMETADSQFVVIHDPNLRRLAGRNEDVKNLTLAELTAITVRDGAGHSDTIPSLEQYVTTAHELGMPLLLEIKMGGKDSPDHVDLLVDELDRLGVFTNGDVIFHSLDYQSVERLKQLRPDATVGYILPLAAGGVPRTSADFIVVEQATADARLQREAEAAGLGFVVWTVDTAEAQRTYLRRGVDGLITDRPDTALEARTAIGDQRGVADTLIDALTRFITIG